MNRSELKEDRKATDDDCSKLKEDEESICKIALARCECLMDRYLRWKKLNLRKSNLAQGIALTFAAITPVLLLLTWEHAKLLGAVASSIAAIATGALAVFNWRDNYIRAGHTWHALQHAKYSYLIETTGEDPQCDAEATRRFARRVEELVLAEVTDWRIDMERSRLPEPLNGNSGGGQTPPSSELSQI